MKLFIFLSAISLLFVFMFIMTCIMIGGKSKDAMDKFMRENELNQYGEENEEA